MTTSQEWGFGSFDLGAMLKNNDISYRTQQHLVHVYGSLAATSVFAALGSVFYLYTHVPWFLTLIGVMGVLFSLHQDTQPAKDKLPKLFLFGFLEGCSIGSLIEVAVQVDPMLIVMAAVASVLVFASFAAVSTLSQRRSYLYLYGMLASATSWLLFSNIMNRFFFQSTAMFDAELYLGLAVFIGWVMADSQMIIERSEMGDHDYVRHTIELFVDLIAIFVRVLVILIKNRVENERRQERKRRRE